MAKIIVTLIAALLSVICLVISIRQFKEKGFVFNNAYLYATKEERERMNKKPYYRQSGIVFSIFAAMLALMAVDIATHTGWLMYVVWILAFAAVIYAIVSAVRIEKKNKK